MRHTEVFTGRVGQVKDLVELNNNNCVVNFSVAETLRVKTKEGTWVDGDTIWTNVTIFGDEARNFVRSVKPGTFVTVIGYRQAKSYTPKDSNESRVIQSVVADQVSVAITKFNYIESIGNVNYAKDGYTGTSQQTQQQSYNQNTSQQTTSQQTAPQDPFEDPFAGGNDDPFAGGDEDPFALS